MVRRIVERCLRRSQIKPDPLSAFVLASGSSGDDIQQS
jgi:hypothetical protein